MTRRVFSVRDVQARYEGAGTGRRMAGWYAPSTGPVQSVAPALPKLRDRVRDAVRNEPLAASIVRVWTNGLVGSGIVARTPGEKPAVRRKIDDAWNAWMPKADAAGVFDFYGIQVLATRGLIESGECFLRIRYRSLSDGLSVPIQIEAIEPDLLPTQDLTLPDGKQIIQGIEFDAEGRRVAYHFYRQHPGDKFGGDLTNLVRVPADQVSHVFMPTRPGQLRGVSPLAPVLTKLRSLGNFDDAVLHRQEIANLFTGFVSRDPTPRVDGGIDPMSGAQVILDGITKEPPKTDFSDVPLVGLEPGTMQELLPGESVNFSEPPDAGTNYADFIRVQYQAIASGTGVPYELMVGDLRDVSDRTLRVSLNEWLRLLESVQWTVVIPKICQFIRAAWCDAAFLAGVLNSKDVDIARRVEWTPPRQRYIHPVQDVQAMQKEVDAGFRSRSSVIAELGRDIADVDAERAAEKERERKLGLVEPPAPLSVAESASMAVDKQLLDLLR